MLIVSCFNLYFPDDIWYGTSFHILICHLCIFFGEWGVCAGLWPFFNCFFFSFLLSFKNSLYILFCSIFYWVAFYCWVLRVLYKYFGYKSFGKCEICKLSPFCGLFFVFFNVFHRVGGVFHFYEVIIINFFSFMYYGLVLCQ